MDDGRYTWAGDICRRLVADPLGPIGLHETSRGPDRPANSDLGLTQCHVFVNDGDPAGNAQLLVRPSTVATSMPLWSSGTTISCWSWRCTACSTGSARDPS